MKKIVAYLLCVFLSISTVFCTTDFSSDAKEVSKEYEQAKQELLNDGYNPIVLNENEKALDKKLTAMKQSYDLEIYNASVITNSAVWETDLYKFCKELPKGSDLHTHVGAMYTPYTYIDFISEYDSVYYNTDYDFEIAADKQNALLLNCEDASSVPTGYINLKQGIANGTINKDFLYSLFLIQNKPLTATGWQYMSMAGNFRLTKVIDYSMAVSMYEEAFRKYCENNVLHIEPRFNLLSKYESCITVLQEMLEAYYKVKMDYPDFSVSIIAACSKGGSNYDDTLRRLSYAAELSKVIMDESDINNPVPFIVGIDLVSEEDKSVDLDQYQDILAQVRAINPDLKITLHAGESLQTSNDNVADAYLLGAARIGHGLHLVQNPTLIEKYKETNRCVELCPISNNLLGYVYDLRTHPGLEYLRRGLAVSICSDDALYMEHEILTDDFYLSILSWNLSLADIKLLCRNSIQYSFTTDSQKQELMASWNKQWNDFVDKALSEY